MDEINKYKIPKTDSNQIINEESESPLKSIEHEVINEVKSRDISLTNNKKSCKKKKKSEQKMFYGRDATYPEELNDLIQPLYCKLCETPLNSIKAAQTHYESKVHFKKIKNWLTEWSRITGEPIPKITKIVNEEFTGSLHCKYCDLELNSIFHARQHYDGKRHKRVVSGFCKPSGSGYYNREGNWVRTIVSVDANNRFGIGSTYISTPEPKKIPIKITPEDEGLVCELCNIRVTSDEQMTMHTTGIKHLRKVKNSIVPDELKIELVKNEKNPLDFSMYRTPSGTYYCKDCNVTINDPSTFNQHLTSKKHAKKIKEKYSELPIKTK